MGLLAPLLAGACAGLLVLSSLVNEYISKNLGMDTSGAQTLAIYATLMLLYVPLCWKRGAGMFAKKKAPKGPQGLQLTDGEGMPQAKKMSLFAACALSDVAANFLILQAFRYLSVPNLLAMSCITPFAAMLLEMRFFRRQPLRQQWLALAGAVVAVSVLFFSDSSADMKDTNEIWIGNVLCLVAYVCYAFSNVAQERLMMHYSSAEYLAYVSVFGTGIAAALAGIFWLADAPFAFRQEQLKLLNGIEFVSLGLFLLAMVLFYSLVPIYFAHGNAPLLNMFFVAGNILATALSFLLFSTKLSWYFVASFSIACLSVAAYSMAPASPPPVVSL